MGDVCCSTTGLWEKSIAGRPNIRFFILLAIKNYLDRFRLNLSTNTTFANESGSDQSNENAVLLSVASKRSKRFIAE